MEKLKTKKDITKMTILFTFTYMISYITRINYGAIIAEMVTSTNLSKALLSMAVTGSFVTYGVGQIISGICGDKFSPKKLVFYGLLLSVSMNILIPFCKNAYQMLFVWCINGFAQAFMWPPIVRLMTTFFSDEDYKKASVKVSWGSSFGTIIVYLTAPVIISLSGYKAVFFFSATLGLIMAFVWNKLCYDAEILPKAHKDKPETKGEISVLFTPLMLGVMLAIILQGMLRDGVTTWMPSYISETYNFSSTISILTGVILPLFSILSFQVASRLYISKLKNPLLCSGVIFGAGAVSSLALVLFTGKSAVLSVIFSALLTGCMHGVNLMLICMVPAFFQKHGNVSTVSGVLNSCTYIGSALSTYGIALLSDKFGWSFTLYVWLSIAVLGTVICLICTKPWKKKMQ